MNKPAVRDYFKRMEAVAGYTAPAAVAVPFDRAREWLQRDPRPQRLAELKPHRYEAVRRGLWPTGDVHLGLLRVHYHRDRVAAIEEAVARAAIESGARELLRAAGRSHAIAGGNSFALDFEYQAFVVATRSCLDYLAVAIAAYFKQDANGFHGLLKALPTWKPPELSAAILALMQVPGIEEFWSDPERRSVRDRISHYQPVRAGVINVRAPGVELVGVPEPSAPNRMGALSLGPLVPIVDAHVARVTRIVESTIDEMIKSDPPVQAA